MCGIICYINTNKAPIRDTGVAVKMLRVQKHRGPDDSGLRAFSLTSGESLEMNVDQQCYIDGCYEGILGFNRLSILDLSINGHQPMVSTDGRVLLAFNGEIYNAFDFKKELQDWGFVFKSSTDTEVVLALYLKLGFDGMLRRLNGMFAIVIIDLNRRGVFIARDRFGIKPLYFFSNENILAFSSELKSFQFIENFSFQLEENKLDEYLIFRSNLTGTLFKNIESLSPGHYLYYSHEDGLVSKKFFDINTFSRAAPESDCIETYTEKLVGLLNNSVRIQLMSDVKLGCQLSGGIDSSLVSWLSKKNSKKGSFETVSIVFKNPLYSEERYINAVTESLGLISHKFLLESDYFLDNIEKATWHLESPINHPNTIAIYKLSQLAKKYVTVLLSGEGADEVFGGYERFYEMAYPYRTRMLFHAFHKNLFSPLNLVKYFNHEYRAIVANSFLQPTMAQRIRNSFSITKSLEERLILYRTLTGSLFDRQIKYEILSFLPDLLIRQDKMSMAHSIENRVPFLDNDLVEYSFGIPEKILLLRQNSEEYNTQKYILKKIAALAFGNEIAFRKKMGFGIPLRDYFNNTEFYEYLQCKIAPSIKDRGLFNYEYIFKLLSKTENISNQEIEALWVVLSFEIWATIFLESH